MFMRIAGAALTLFLAACATTGATFRSGVGDRFLEHPPYYAGEPRPIVSPASRVARLPVEFQRGAAQDAAFDPARGPGSSVAALISGMEALLDSVLPASRVVRVPPGDGLVSPNVYFGCERDGTNDCVTRGDSVLGRQGTTMRLAVERPSAAWIQKVGPALDSAEAPHLLMITLVVGQYWPRQTGLRGDKSVELGTNHIVQLPWLTSLETPVSVLQVTGALISREGRAVRIGAEGILAQRTPLVASGFGAQRLIAPEDVERARTLRRDDLPGRPLAWQEAVCRLVQELGAGSCARR